jgi:hypothetical protein
MMNQKLSLKIPSYAYVIVKKIETATNLIQADYKFYVRKISDSYSKANWIDSTNKCELNGISGEEKDASKRE